MQASVVLRRAVTLALRSRSPTGGCTPGRTWRSSSRRSRTRSSWRRSPSATLSCAPQRGAAETRLLLQQHTLVGQRILAAVPALHEIGMIVRSTHEWWDGCGAMVADRPYAAPKTTDEALDELVRCAGTRFDPAVVEMFAAVLPAHGRFSVAAA